MLCHLSVIQVCKFWIGIGRKSKNVENFNIFKKTDKDGYILWMTVFTSRNCFCISNPKIKKPKENFPLQLWYIRFILVLIWAFIHIIHSSLDNINSTPSILQLRWHRSRSLTNDSHLPPAWSWSVNKLNIQTLISQV